MELRPPRGLHKAIMNRRRHVTGLTFMALAFGNVADADVTAFVNVNVVPMDREIVLEAQTVIVEGERIREIGAVAATSVPDGVTVVDGTDRFLLPGLAEMHGHVTDTSPRSLDRTLGLFVANGVTTVRGMLGRAAHLELRERILSHQVLGPRLITSGPSFNGSSVSSPAQAASKVRAQYNAGYDFLKIHPGLSRSEFRAIAATAAELGIPFAGHVPADVGVLMVLDSGMSTIDHLDGYMQALVSPNEDPSGGFDGFFGLLLAGAARESRIQEIAERTAAAGVWNVATQSLFEHTANSVPPEDIAEWPEMKYVSPATLDQWSQVKLSLLNEPTFDRAMADRAIEIRRKLILALHQAGAGLLLGSDSPQRFNVPGFALHRELELLVKAGLTPFEALRTGTVDASRFFGASDRGTIAVGAVADLVLLDDNPLMDIANSRRVHGTMLRGRWVSRPELDSILSRAEWR